MPLTRVDIYFFGRDLVCAPTDTLFGPGLGDFLAGEEGFDLRCDST